MSAAVLDSVVLLPMSINGRFLLKITLAGVEWEQLNTIVNSATELMRNNKGPFAVIVDASELDTKLLKASHTSCAKLAIKVRDSLMNPDWRLQCLVITGNDTVVKFVQRVKITGISVESCNQSAMQKLKSKKP